MDVQKANILGKNMDLLRNLSEKIDPINNKRSSLLWCVVILIQFSAVFCLNLLTPLISDDFAYKFVYGEDRMVSSIGDVLTSQVNHYYLWGGRSVVHAIAQVLLLLPPYVADLLNSLVYMGYIFLIYFHIKGRGKNSLSLFVLISLAVWFLQPVLGDTVFWLTGAANYLWGTTFILLFLLPFRLYHGDTAAIASVILKSIGIFLLGIIAGWTNENTAGAMLLITILFCVYYSFRRWKIPVWLVAGIVGALIGYIIMIAAPGNYVRAGEGSFSLFMLVYRFFNCTQTLLIYCSPLILVTLIMYIVFYHFSVIDRKVVSQLSLIYVVAAIAAVYAMVLSPTFPRRALFGVVTYLIIGPGILFYNLDFSQSILRQLRTCVVSFGLFCFLFAFYFAFKEINSFKETTEQRKEIIEQAKNEGKTSVEFERFSGGIYIHGEDPFSGQLMSRYYDVEIKLIVPQD